MPLGGAESIAALDPEWVAALREEEEEYLRRIANRCMEEHGLVARTDLLAGPSANAIVAAARDSGDALVVMTTHGRGGLSRAWLGSIADAVVRRSPVPVLLIRPDDAAAAEPTIEPRNVLIPVDGSRLSEGILDAAIAVGRLTGARYTLLKVVPTSAIAAYPMASTFGIGPEAFEEMRLGAANYLNELARRIAERYHVEVDTALVPHPIPAEAILQQADARGVDMIALATHGRGGWTRMALGSVADKVMRGAKVPVLLYRPPVPVENGGGSREAVHAA
jgi:nucleotide-binding universal stress UspA family protein